MDAHFHGTKTKIQGRRYVLVRETFDVAQNDHAAHVGTQSHQSFIEATAQIALIEGSGGIQIPPVNIIEALIFKLG